jgi:hypothetical protein
MEIFGAKAPTRPNTVASQVFTENHGSTAAIAAAFPKNLSIVVAPSNLQGDQAAKSTIRDINEGGHSDLLRVACVKWRLGVSASGRCAAL